MDYGENQTGLAQIISVDLVSQWAWFYPGSMSSHDAPIMGGVNAEGKTEISNVQTVLLWMLSSSLNIVGVVVN